MSSHGAVIMETKLRGNTWDDVLKVNFEGAVYSIKDVISIEGVGHGYIIAFRPAYVLVSPHGDRYEYEYISLVSGAKLNPNQAFKRKKRRMF